jgi:hypothetical protein
MERAVRKLETEKLRVPMRAVPSLTGDGITWRTRGDVVQITVEVVNDGALPTEAMRLHVQAALLGAFAPWRSVVSLGVGALRQGETRTVSVGLPRSVLPVFGATMRAMARAMGQPVEHSALALLDSAEWAGNLNVWFDVAPEKAVEVHRALGLKIAAGRPVALGVFLPRAEAGFDIAVKRNPPSWTAEVIRIASSTALLVVEAPAARQPGAVSLLVTRRSDRRSVPVDFSFESVDGPSEQLGCLTVRR